MRPFLMRLRSLMIVVAIVAVGLAGARVAGRACLWRYYATGEQQCRQRASTYERKLAFFSKLVAEGNTRRLASSGWSIPKLRAARGVCQRRAIQEQELAEVNATLARQYECATWRFWEPMPGISTD